VKPVIVDWVDSHRILSEWTMLDEIDEDDMRPTAIVSAGFLYRNEPEFIVLVQNNGGDQLEGGIVIPRSAINMIRPWPDAALAD
jgi:hypothetical protein